MQRDRPEILVITDFATKFTKFVAIPDKTPETVAEGIFTHFIAEYGSPAIIVSDQDKCFCSKLSHQLFNLLGIDKRRTTAFHPQCNASSERRNAHIIKYLTSMLEDQPLEWEKMLPAMQLSYNCAVHKTTKQTPFMLMHGVHPRAPFLDPNQTEKIFYGEDYIAELKNRLKFARELARKNSLMYRQKYTSSHDKKVNTWFKLKKGDLVWLHRPELPKINPKIQSPWEGPYVIHNLVGEQNAFVQNLQNEKTRFVHVNRLKPYVSSPSNTIPVAKNQTSGENTLAEAQRRMHMQSEKRPAQPQFLEVEDDEVVILSGPSEISRHRPLLQPKQEETDTDEDDSSRSEDQTEDNLPEQTVRYHYMPSKTYQSVKSKRTLGQKIKGLARAAEDVIAGETNVPSHVTGPLAGNSAASSSDYYAQILPAAPTTTSTVSPLTRSHAARQAISLPPAGAPPARPPEYRPRRGRGMVKKQD